MLLLKKNVVIGLFLLFMVLIIHRSCTTLDQTAESKELYAGLERNEILDKCISCHHSVYENEMIGPHSISYKALLEHSDFSNRPEYSEKQYTHYLNEVLSVECVKCHAPDNLFETNFKGFESIEDIGECSKKTHPEFYGIPRARKTVSTFNSGIDCLTCHYTETNVIAGKDFIENPENRSMEDYCFPVASPLLTSNISCAPCHNYAVEDMQKNLESGLITQDLTCNSCHQEYENGKGTHYFYWKHDPSEKKKENYMGSLFVDFNASMKNNEIEIVWKNSAIPHVFNRIREIVTKLEVLDANEQIIMTHLIRLNRKKEGDEQMAPVFAKYDSVFGAYNLPGVHGYIFRPGDVIKEKIALPDKSSKPVNIKLSAYNKGQYWFPDSTGVLVYEKTFPLKDLYPN